MAKYDDDIPRRKSNNITVKSQDIINEYSDELCDMVINYGKQGGFIEAFAGRFNIDIDEMLKWVSSPDGEYMKFKASVKISISSALDYWYTRLVTAIDNPEENAQSIPHIRAMIGECLKRASSELSKFCYGGFRTKTAEEIEAEKKFNIGKDLASSMTGLDYE